MLMNPAFSEFWFLSDVVGVLSFYLCRCAGAEGPVSWCCWAPRLPEATRHLVLSHVLPPCQELGEEVRAVLAWLRVYTWDRVPCITRKSSIRVPCGFHTWEPWVCHCAS